MRHAFLSLVALAAGAQTLTFEVASIKPNRSLDVRSSIRFSKGRLAAQNVSLRKVILNAYGIPDDREYMLDGPAWLATERFDIDATFPADAAPEQVRQMLESMLKDRFRLALHRDTRQLPAYSLTVAKGGPRIQPVEDGQGRTSGAPGRLEATKITMRKLADLLGRLTGVPVIDSTSLEGVFDFTLEWSPDQPPNMAAPDIHETAAGSGPSLFTALQEQLGLKLVSGKQPLEILVVDHMEKTPTAN